ncbi:uncharacterized protein LOC108476752 isoform X1 [Gossypium arboreum]|uniref:uncharacterized protein LOC108476752 isoform X1 n=1 Tax=Gossypium arboreum TaxID=29729 RepID=UPI0022F14C49|nr:uncharacterized protein LOC108476752 isoform X1 [Gossypium arboreum]
MEGSSSQLFDDDQKSSGASKFLFNLPSRGHLSSTVISSNLGGMRVYICEHNTSPPESQHIKTNQQNILIRSLMLNDKNGDSSSKDVKAAAEGPRKRAAERVMDSKASAKKANTQVRILLLIRVAYDTETFLHLGKVAKHECGITIAEGSSSRAEKDYHSLTVERLRALLKERGLSPKGKKDELIARLKCVNGSSQKSE